MDRPRNRTTDTTRSTGPMRYRVVPVLRMRFCRTRRTGRKVRRIQRRISIREIVSHSGPGCDVGLDSTEGGGKNRIKTL